jgi:hypothetical protein
MVEEELEHMLEDSSSPSLPHHYWHPHRQKDRPHKKVNLLQSHRQTKELLTNHMIFTILYPRCSFPYLLEIILRYSEINVKITSKSSMSLSIGGSSRP